MLNIQMSQSRWGLCVIFVHSKNLAPYHTYSDFRDTKLSNVPWANEENMFPERFLEKERKKRKTMILYAKGMIILCTNTNDLQSDQTGEALEDVNVQTANTVVGQVSVTHREKKASGLFLPHFRSNTTWQL